MKNRWIAIFILAAMLLTMMPFAAAEEESGTDALSAFSEEAITDDGASNAEALNDEVPDDEPYAEITETSDEEPEDTPGTQEIPQPTSTPAPAEGATAEGEETPVESQPEDNRLKSFCVNGSYFALLQDAVHAAGTEDAVISLEEWPVGYDEKVVIGKDQHITLDLKSCSFTLNMLENYGDLTICGSQDASYMGIIRTIGYMEKDDSGAVIDSACGKTTIKGSFNLDGVFSVLQDRSRRIENNEVPTVVFEENVRLRWDMETFLFGLCTIAEDGTVTVEENTEPFITGSVQIRSGVVNNYRGDDPGSFIAPECKNAVYIVNSLPSEASSGNGLPSTDGSDLESEETGTETNTDTEENENVSESQPQEPEVFTVSYDYNNNEDGSDKSEIQVEQNTETEIPSVNREGYRLSGWLCIQNGRNYQPGDRIKVQYALNFIAQWEKLIMEDITFNILSGEGYVGYQDKEIGDGEKLIVVAGEEPTFTFLPEHGFQLDKVTTYTSYGIETLAVVDNALSLSPVTRPITLNVYYKTRETDEDNLDGTGTLMGISALTLSAAPLALDYQITYELNNGAVAGTLASTRSNPEIFPENTAVTYPTSADITPPSGYKFGGWYENNTYSGEKVTQKPAERNESFTLYAKWNPIYTITYEAGGGVVSASAPRSFTEEDTVTVSGVTCTKTGATFDGWYFDAARTEPAVVIGPGRTGNVTLYAKWLHKVNVYYNDYGKVTSGGITIPSGQSITVSEGASLTLDFTSLTSGYGVYNVTINNARQGSISSYTLNNITQDTTVVVTFARTTLSPITGDSSNIYLWLGLLAGSAILAAGVLLVLKKRNK